MRPDSNLFRRGTTLALGIVLCFGSTTKLQSQGQALQENGRAAITALLGWIALDAPPGWEHLATDVLVKALSGWQRDALGNLILRKGSARAQTRCSLRARPARICSY